MFLFYFKIALTFTKFSKHLGYTFLSQILHIYIVHVLFLVYFDIYIFYIHLLNIKIV